MAFVPLAPLTRFLLLVCLVLEDAPQGVQHLRWAFEELHGADPCPYHLMGYLDGQGVPAKG